MCVLLEVLGILYSRSSHRSRILFRSMSVDFADGLYVCGVHSAKSELETCLSA